MQEQDIDRSNALSKAIGSLKVHLTSSQKKKMIGLSFLIFISAVFDVFGLASILPLVKLAAEPSIIFKNNILTAIYTAGGFANEKNFLLFVIIGVFAFFLFKTIFGLFVNYLQTKFSTAVAYDITQRQFEKYFALDFNHFSSIKSSSMIHHVINNPISYITWVVLPLIMLLSETIIVLLIVGGIAFYDFKLFVFISIIIGPATWLIYRLLKNKSAHIGLEMNKIFPQSMGTLNQTVIGYIDIKLADKEELYKNKFLRLQKSYHALNMQSYLHNLIPMRANEMVALTGVILIFIYAIFLTDNTGSAVVMVSLFAAAAYRLMPSLNRIISSMVYIQKNLGALENLNLYQDTIQKSEVKQEEIRFTDKITLENISFKFPNQTKNIINDVSIAIKKGEKIGIIGSSGSGKTTLINILLKFHNNYEGSIKIDNTVLSDSHLKSWRKLIGYVKQDIFLMDASILDNITFNDSNPDQTRLKSAVEQSSLTSFIDSLPEGLNTKIGERGSSLSGGQKQRLSIARSLYRNAEILIFDEATSALDNQTEQEVSDAIDQLSNTQKTIIIIAHRLTTLKNCDRIYELQEGKIAAVHQYSDLIKNIN
jgi:ABC-type multidrug transport system fused ATPase/permease subunit